jgi:hypothetical protein
MPVYGKVLGNATTHSGTFFKDDPSIVAFSRAGTFAVSTSTEITVAVGNRPFIVPANTKVYMPTVPIIGADYQIWITPKGILKAEIYPIIPEDDSKLIGGFHYAPGGNAVGLEGGSADPQINPYSFWDLKFRPICKDARGMTLVADNFWCDIYLTGNTAVSTGLSTKYGVTIADANSSPIVPIEFGGNGANTYGGYTWYEAHELAGAFGKRPLTEQEFSAAAYGVTENLSANTDPVITGLDAPRTSKWGLMQATGNMFIYCSERGAANTAAAWHAVTDGRGSEYQEPYAIRLGGAYNSTTDSGSRCARGTTEAQTELESGVAVNGSRFASDHFQAD